MATLILETVGATVGQALGGPIGSTIGRVLGAAGGRAIDNALLGGGGKPRFVEGPRLSEIAGLTSSEGEPIPRLYGRARLGGTLIWATRPLEVANTTVERSSSGAKGGSGQKTVRTAYSYYANIAVGLCAGPIAGIRRVWADGTELDLTTLNLRVHTGGPDQAPDPLIVAKEGAEFAPAYRGLAYVVFERLALADYGNRIPQLAFEVLRPVGGIAEKVRAVCLIPGSTEFGLDPALVTEDAGLGATRPANRFQLQAGTDVLASLDALQALCPSLARVSVVVSWFGSDLRAGHCRIGPRVDQRAKLTSGDVWQVAGLSRDTADLVSQDGGGAAYGGTPSDAGLLRLIAELKRRGLDVVLYPFLMMDVPAGNTLPDPRRPGEHQPPYPWRGRITCDPAPGLPGSPDGTAGAATQVAAFFEGLEGYRRLVLHYAGLCAASGLSGFIVGSEFVGLTRIRDAVGYPAVSAFRALAQDARAILGPSVALVYAADWTEYGAHVREGDASVRFPLDPLLADPAIDAVGIDYYPPITDWRDGTDHADAAEAPEIYDRAHLKNRLGAGEAFDWFYASEADRAAQIRSPITDGAHGKPWMFRPKDLVAWWSSPHVERVGGIETGATAWLPGMKPIWLTEIGVPAIDRGTNGPNVFPDPKSSENAAPPFSRGHRDDLIQARGLEAILSRFDPALPGFDPAHNPIAAGLRMVDPANIYVWCWDARPFPAFPDFDTVWTDAGNWALGHWLNGRAEGQELDRLLAAILSDFGIDAPLDLDVAGFLDGTVIDRPLSARAVLEPLAELFCLGVAVSAGTLRITGPRGPAPFSLSAEDLVLPRDESAPLRRVRAEESALPRTLELGFSDGESDGYRRASVSALRPAGARRREARIEAAIVTRRGQAEMLAESALEASLAARDSAAFAVSPRTIAFEPGDRLLLPDGALHRIVRIADGPGGRSVETAGVPELDCQSGGSGTGGSRPRRPLLALPGPAFAAVLDLPVTRGDPVPLQFLAAAAEPWPGPLALWRADGSGAPLSLQRLIEHPACLGRTLSELPPGRLWRFERGTALDVELRHAEGLGAVPETSALAGANLFALVGADGAVEILSAAGIELTGPGTFRLSNLLRGLAGSEPVAARTLPAGSLIVRLDDGAVVPLVARLDEAGRSFAYRLGPASRGPADPAAIGFSATAGLISYRPLAPVHLRARREVGGVRLSWIRRARREADAWETAEIPFDEPAQSYGLDILAEDGSLIRSSSAATTNLLYAAADEAADFGGPQSAITVSVAQIGMIAGRGASLQARVPIRAA